MGRLKFSPHQLFRRRSLVPPLEVVYEGLLVSRDCGSPRQPSDRPPPARSPQGRSSRRASTRRCPGSHCRTRWRRAGTTPSTAAACPPSSSTPSSSGPHLLAAGPMVIGENAVVPGAGGGGVHHKTCVRDTPEAFFFASGILGFSLVSTTSMRLPALNSSVLPSLFHLSRPTPHSHRVTSFATPPPPGSDPFFLPPPGYGWKGVPFCSTLFPTKNEAWQPMPKSGCGNGGMAITGLSRGGGRSLENSHSFAESIRF